MSASSLRGFSPAAPATSAAGGTVFAISDMELAKRFLILGSEKTFYVTGEKMTASNAKNLIKLASSPESSKALVDEIVAVSLAGRAPKQDPALFALAVAASYGTDESKRYALDQLSKVARTASTLFTFVSFARTFRPWGRALRRAVAEWYVGRDADKAAYQIVKYRQRDGWAHKDLFKVSHPKTADPAFIGLGEWVLRDDVSAAPTLVKGYELASKATTAELPALIREYGLSWEMIPTAALNDKDVWDALLDGNVPLGALLRQLPRLTRIGIVGPMVAGRTRDVVSRLSDANEIERARIHPLAVLKAHNTYASGRSVKGTSTWTPVREIVEALDNMFYAAFGNVEVSGKRTLIGLDVSGSMGYSSRDEELGLTPREITAALALITRAVEPYTHVIGFTGGGRDYGWSYSGSRKATPAGSGKFGSSVTDLDSAVTDDRRLADVIRDISGLPFGSTDISLPMLYALERKLEIDTFLIMTDNETLAGTMRPKDALALYNKTMGREARLVVLSTEATRSSVCDPDDPNSLDLAGFDSSAPSVIAAFSRGDF